MTADTTPLPPEAVTQSEPRCVRCEARDRDWWKPEPEDPFWMLETEDGEWLKNADSLLGTRDPSKAIRFPTEQDAYNHPARMRAGSKWWSAKPTDHSWIVMHTRIAATSAAEGEVEARVAELEDENLRLIACGKEMIMGNRRARSRATAAEAALAELEANAIRSEQHRNDLYDKIVLQTTEVSALKAALADERARVSQLEGLIAQLEAALTRFDPAASAIRGLATVKETT